MTKLSNWHQTVQLILTDVQHPFYEWLTSIQGGIQTFEQCQHLNCQLGELIQTASASKEVELIQQLDCLKHVWKVQRRYYFTHLFPTEARQPRYFSDFLSQLDKPIQTFQEYEALELKWNEVQTRLLDFPLEFQGLMRIELRRVFNKSKHLYLKTISKTEYKKNNQHPYYNLATFLNNHVMLTKEEFVTVKRELIDLEQLTLKQFDSLQKIWWNKLKILHAKALELYGVSEAEGKTKWEICRIYLTLYPEWSKTNEVLHRILQLEENVTPSALDDVSRLLQISEAKRRREMTAIDFEWIQNEFEKHLRLLSKRQERQKSGSFGEWIRQLRKVQNLSLKELERRSGVSASHIYRLETGERDRPAFAIAEKIAKGLGASSMEVLLYLEGDGEKPKEEEDLIQIIEHNPVRLGGELLTASQRKALIRFFSTIQEGELDPMAPVLLDLKNQFQK